MKRGKYNTKECSTRSLLLQEERAQENARKKRSREEAVRTESVCEEQSQGMWHRWSLKHQQHKVGDKAGEVRGKKRQGQESVESTSEDHCSKDGRTAVRVCVEIDRWDRR